MASEPSAEAALHDAKPCPFCGGLKLAARVEGLFVECLSCGGQGAFVVVCGPTDEWFPPTGEAALWAIHEACNKREEQDNGP